MLFVKHVFLAANVRESSRKADGDEATHGCGSISGIQKGG
jgi:hypothetical protein